MLTLGISACPGVFIELKESTNIDFEKDSHSEIRDVVTTIVHHHTPPDVDTHTHIMSIEKEMSQGESE